MFNSISFTCSVAGTIYAPKNTHYSSSKAALLMFSECLKFETRMKKRNIHITIICPWAINTGLVDCVNMSGIVKLFPMLD